MTICAALAVPSVGIAEDFSFRTFDAPDAAQYGTVLSGINAGGMLVGSYVTGRTPMTRYTHYFTSDGTSVSPTEPDTPVANHGAHGLNDDGVVVGTERNHGAVRTRGTWSTFDAPNCSGFTVGRGINNGAEIVGSCDASGGSALFGFWRSADGSEFMAVEVPGAAATTPRAINGQSTIVGEYTLAGQTHGFYFDGSYVTIDFPGALRTYLTGIDNSGNIVGYYYGADSHAHGLIWEGSTFRTIDVPEAIDTYVLGSSADGVLAGYYRNNGSMIAHGFIARPN